jgi:hypothetical protein
MSAAVETAPVVYFNVKLNAWTSTDGTPVCQDHATPEPCPFHGRHRR